MRGLDQRLRLRANPLLPPATTSARTRSSTATTPSRGAASGPATPSAAATSAPNEQAGPGLGKPAGILAGNDEIACSIMHAAARRRAEHPRRCPHHRLRRHALCSLVRPAALDRASAAAGNRRRRGLDAHPSDRRPSGRPAAAAIEDDADQERKQRVSEPQCVPPRSSRLRGCAALRLDLGVSSIPKTSRSSPSLQS